MHSYPRVRMERVLAVSITNGTNVIDNLAELVFV